MYRQVCLELSLLVVALENECTRENCPEMKADGWLYLCAAHPSTQSVSWREGVGLYIHTHTHGIKECKGKDLCT